MRITIFSVLVAGMVVGGCTRSDATTPGNALAAPASVSRDAAFAPVATTGRTEAARAPEVVPVADAGREVTIPAGTLLAVTLDTSVGSDTRRVEQPVAAHLTRPIRVHGETVLAMAS